MALVNFKDLDFDQIKENIKDYLRSNSNFTDYDFEGSNLSTIIDVLAYNTYISSYNANMVSNEVFIDSATLRENVVSLARNIGYTPRSKQCSIANISFFVEVEDSKALTATLKKGVVATSSGSFGSQSFVFSIPDDITVPIIDGFALFDNIQIYEGNFIIENFNTETENNLRYVIDNPDVDTNTLRVFVSEIPESNVFIKYNLSETLIDINPNSKVFYIQEIEDQRYEIIFGDGIFGKKVDPSSNIEISYIVTSGEIANGITNFTYTGRIVDNNSNIISSGISILSTLSPSRNGKEIESIDSIKKYSTRIYSAQNRAVTSRDYESIIPKIYPQTESISVFGGEELDPPKFGKVFITIKPLRGNFLSQGVKDNIKNELRKYSVAGIVPEIIDLKYLNIEVLSNVYYNPNLSRGPKFELDLIYKNIEKYSKSSELNQYGSRFKYSKFLNIIDNSSKAITSNITLVSIRRDLRPEIDKFAEYEICYGNSFHIKNKCDGYNIKSSGFIIDGVSGIVYLSDMPKTSSKGTLFLFKFENDSNIKIVRKNVGMITYDKGEIILNPIKILNTVKLKDNVPIIEISISPKSNDIVGKQDLYLQMNINDVQINMIEDNIESGSDISGSNFFISSSYLNGELIRR